MDVENLIVDSSWVELTSSSSQECRVWRAGTRVLVYSNLRNSTFSHFAFLPLLFLCLLFEGTRESACSPILISRTSISVFFLPFPFLCIYYFSIFWQTLLSGSRLLVYFYFQTYIFAFWNFPFLVSTFLFVFSCNILWQVYDMRVKYSTVICFFLLFIFSDKSVENSKLEPSTFRTFISCRSTLKC